MSKKTVYVGVGVPGSGKSTWWETGVGNGTIPKTAVRVNMDQIRKEITGTETDQSKNDLVAKVAKSTLAGALSQHIDVIYWDNTSAQRKYRKEIVEIAKKAGYAVIGIWFDADLSVAKDRNSKRTRKVPEDILEKMHNSIQSVPPSLDEGFDQIIVVK